MGTSGMGDCGGDAASRAPQEGKVHSKDWERLQLESLPREGSGSRSPGGGSAVSEPPSVPSPCPAEGDCSTPSEQRRSPKSWGGATASAGWKDTKESPGPSGEPGGQEALTRGGLGGAGY